MHNVRLVISNAFIFVMKCFYKGEKKDLTHEINTVYDPILMSQIPAIFVLFSVQ